MPLETMLFNSKGEATGYLRRIHPPSHSTMAEIKRYYRIKKVTRYQIVRCPRGDAKGKW